MHDIFSYYSKLLGIKRLNKEQIKKNNKFESSSLNIETLSDFADYKVKESNPYENPKILHYFESSCGFSFDCYFFIPKGLDDVADFSLVNLKLLGNFFYLINKLNLIKPQYDNYQDAIRNGNINMRLRYNRFYCFHDTFILKNKNLLSNFWLSCLSIMLFKNTKNIYNNFDINFINKCNYISEVILKRSIFYFCCDVSIIGLSAFNTLLPHILLNDVIATANFQLFDGLLLTLIYGTHFSIMIGGGYRFRLMDSCSLDIFSIFQRKHVINIIKKQTDKSSMKLQKTDNNIIRTNEILENFRQLLQYIQLKNIDLIFGCCFYAELVPWYMSSRFSVLSDHTFKDIFFNFYYGISFVSSVFLFEGKCGIGMMNLSVIVLRLISNKDKIDNNMNFPRIGQGSILFRNSLSTLSLCISLLL